MSTRLSFAVDDRPPRLYQSVGALGGEEVKNPSTGVSEAGKRMFFVGTNALSVRRDHMRIESIMRDGIITDWDATEALMEHSFKSCMSGMTAPTPSLAYLERFAAWE